MKSNQHTTSFLNKKSTGGRAPAPQPVSARGKKEDELVVIRDVSNNKEYYLSVIDTFVYAKKEYVVMYNYVPDDGNHDKPELVIMRTEFTSKGDQLFYSIKDGKELEIAFSYFMRRYYNSDAPDRRMRRGVK